MAKSQNFAEVKNFIESQETSPGYAPVIDKLKEMLFFYDIAETLNLGVSFKSGEINDTDVAVIARKSQEKINLIRSKITPSALSGLSVQKKIEIFEALGHIIQDSSIKIALKDTVEAIRGGGIDLSQISKVTDKNGASISEVSDFSLGLERMIKLISDNISNPDLKDIIEAQRAEIEDLKDSFEAARDKITLIAEESQRVLRTTLEGGERINSLVPPYGDIGAKLRALDKISTQEILATVKKIDTSTLRIYRKYNAGQTEKEVDGILKQDMHLTDAEINVLSADGKKELIQFVETFVTAGKALIEKLQKEIQSPDLSVEINGKKITFSSYDEKVNTLGKTIILVKDIITSPKTGSDAIGFILGAGWDWLMEPSDFLLRDKRFWVILLLTAELAPRLLGKVGIPVLGKIPQIAGKLQKVKGEKAREDAKTHPDSDEAKLAKERIAELDVLIDAEKIKTGGLNWTTRPNKIIKNLKGLKESWAVYLPEAEYRKHFYNAYEATTYGRISTINRIITWIDGGRGSEHERKALVEKEKFIVDEVTKMKVSIEGFPGFSYGTHDEKKAEKIISEATKKFFTSAEYTELLKSLSSSIEGITAADAEVAEVLEVEILGDEGETKRAKVKKLLGKLVGGIRGGIETSLRVGVDISIKGFEALSRVTTKRDSLVEGIERKKAEILKKLKEKVNAELKAKMNFELPTGSLKDLISRDMISEEYVEEQKTKPTSDAQKIKETISLRWKGDDYKIRHRLGMVDTLIHDLDKKKHTGTISEFRIRLLIILGDTPENFNKKIPDLGVTSDEVYKSLTEKFLEFEKVAKEGPLRKYIDKLEAEIKELSETGDEKTVKDAIEKKLKAIREKTNPADIESGLKKMAPENEKSVVQEAKKALKEIQKLPAEVKSVFLEKLLGAIGSASDTKDIGEKVEKVKIVIETVNLLDGELKNKALKWLSESIKDGKSIEKFDTFILKVKDAYDIISVIGDEKMKKAYLSSLETTFARQNSALIEKLTQSIELAKRLQVFVNGQVPQDFTPALFDDLKRTFAEAVGETSVDVDKLRLMDEKITEERTRIIEAKRLAGQVEVAKAGQKGTVSEKGIAGPNELRVFGESGLTGFARDLKTRYILSLQLEVPPAGVTWETFLAQQEERLRAFNGLELELSENTSLNEYSRRLAIINGNTEVTKELATIKRELTSRTIEIDGVKYIVRSGDAKDAKTIQDRVEALRAAAARSGEIGVGTSIEKILEKLRGEKIIIDKLKKV